MTALALFSGLGGGCGERTETSGPWPSPHHQLFPRLLLTGPPQCGKTTVVRRVVEGYQGRATGFFTREVREGGRRVGFQIVTLTGEAAWLSHVDIAGPRVGRYGVDVAGFERLALPALTPAAGVELVVVDEIGRMECLSAAFVQAVARLWSAPAALLATVAAQGGGLIRDIKTQPGARLITVTPANRDRLPREILTLLTPSP